MSGLVSHDKPSFLSQVRRPAIVVAVLAATVFFLFGLRYAGESSPRWLDTEGFDLVRAWLPVRRGVARTWINLYDPKPLAVIVAALAVLCLLLRRWWLAVLAVLGPVLTGVATTLLKQVVDRTKDGDLAYPSGHGAAATAIALVAALLLVSVLPLPLWGAVAVVTGITVLTGAGITVAMVMANYHYLTDALGGFCVAVAVVLALALVLERWVGHPQRTPS